MIFIVGIEGCDNSCEQREIQDHLYRQDTQEEKVQILIEEDVLLEDLHEDVPVDTDILAMISHMQNVEVIPNISLPFHCGKKSYHNWSPYQERFNRFQADQWLLIFNKVADESDRNQHVDKRWVHIQRYSTENICRDPSETFVSDNSM